MTETRDNPPVQTTRQTALPGGEATPAAPSTAIDLRDKLRSFFSFRRGGRPIDKREQVKIAAMVIALSALIAVCMWGAFLGYESLSAYWLAEVAETDRHEAPASDAQEKADALSERKEAEAAARQALEDARKLRQINEARIQADRYQWNTWKHTFQDIEENNRRLKEKQRIADEEAAEEERREKMEKERQYQEAQRKAAELAARTRPSSQVRMKKTIRGFD